MSPWLNSTSERDERQRRDQVERAHRPQPAPVEEAGEEDRAHRPEHERPVHLAPVGVGEPAGEHPPHLRAGPHLVGPPRRVLRCAPAAISSSPCSSSPSTRAAGRGSAEWVTCEYWPIQALTARERLAMTNACVAREARRALRRGELHAGDGALSLGHGDRGEDVLGALRLEEDRPDAPRPDVPRLEVRTRVLRQERHDPAVGLGELDRLRRPSGDGRRRGRPARPRARPPRRPAGDDATTETSRACCQGSSPAAP